MANDRQLQDLGEVHLCVEAYVLHDGKVLMHHRSPNKKHFPGYLIGPGGHINEGEDVAAAACREIEEETGIVVRLESMKLKYVGIHNHTDTERVWVNCAFLCRPENLEGSLRQSKEGHSEWIDFEQLIRIKDTIFSPTLEYFDHVINDDPGILYTSSEWDDNHLKRTLSKNIVKA